MPRISAPVPVPSPWGGINTREGIGALQPHEARHLVNLNPEGNSVQPRKGFTVWSAGGSSEEAVETLAPFNGLTGTALLGVTMDGTIWDFSNSTASVVSAAGYAESRWQHDVYNNFLFAVNGVDTPWRYNGSAVSATGFSGSGLTLTDLVNVRKVRQRLWFCENNSADVWYGGIGLITGSLTKFQLSQVVGGGTCMFIAAHSQDAGDGPDDFTCFVMSTGEIVLYSGDPGSSFAKVGNYFMPQPVGRQSFCNVGGGLVTMTHGGLIPIEAAVNGTAGDMTALGNFGKFAPTLKRYVDRYGNIPGWSQAFHEGRVIINIPTEADTTTIQAVFNTLTGTWTTWAGINAGSIAVQGDELYFGKIDDGEVCKIGGSLDEGELTNVHSHGAFVVPGNGLKMKVTGIRFDMTIEGSISGKYVVDTDYFEKDMDDLPTVDLASSTASTPWGSAWGSDWSNSRKYSGKWFSAYAEGHSLAIGLDATVNASSLEWLGAHLLTRQTGI